jgi:vacuolar-type H+-ATPase subunit E/Vma4
MGLERLLASLEHDAQVQADALLADARERAARATAEAHERATRRKDDTLAAREHAQRTAAELALARARRAGRARVLEARAHLLDQVFRAAQERLPAAAASAEFRATLPDRLAAARACFGGAPAVLRCAPQLLDPLRKAVGRANGVTLRADAGVATGFVLESTDGALAVDETLATRLAQQRQALAVAVLAALQAEAGAA